MAQTDSKKNENKMVDHGDIAGGAVVTAQGAAKMRLPYPKSLANAFSGEDEKYNVDQRRWQVLIDSIFPSAKTIEAVCMAVEYCRSRKLDIMKKPVHIVPVWSTAENRMVETVWQSITEIRITAARTGSYAGKDATDFGPNKTRKFSHTHQGKTEEVELTFPEWAQVTVYRLVQGVRCPFVGPKVYWEESYATKDKWSEIPNAMWSDRKSGQLEKCAEAAALRLAFPEELGTEYAAEEVAGKSFDTIPGFAAKGGASADVIVSPTQPARSDFERQEDQGEKKPAPAASAPAAAPKADPAPKAQATEGDQRPEPPPPEGVVEEVKAEVVEDEPAQAAQADEADQTAQATAADTPNAFDDWYKDQIAEMDKIDTIRLLAAHYDGVMKELEGDDERMREFTKKYEARQDAIKAAKKKK